MQYEIEIKSLLGSQEATDVFLEKVKAADSSMQQFDEQKQLNHYFKNGTLPALMSGLDTLFSDEQKETLRQIADTATSVNVRSREKNGKVLLIVKGSLDGASAAHSHQRMEFEMAVPYGIDELDEKIQQSGWELEAKWQAERKFYKALGLTLDVFFTPGYGYVVEFEKVVTDDTDRDAAHNQVVAVMEMLGVEELPNDRLERMFAYYNAHWRDYYGTRNVFVVE